MSDYDYFNNYKDVNGHPFVDLCLHQVAEALRLALRRPADGLARYGGEEFAVLLPSTPVDGAMAVAEAIAHRLADLALPHAGSPLGVVTVCIRAAALTPSGAT